MTREEAIRRIKVWNLDSDDREVLEVIIPELKESEDEGIRKALIEFLREAYSKGIAPEECAKWVVWLDKPKEQKLAERAIMQDFNYHEGEPDEKAWSRLIAILNYAEATSNDTPGEEVQALINWVKEKQIGCKSAKWNNADDKIQRNLMSLLTCMRGDRIAEDTYKKYYSWLRDLPKRFNLKQSAEWSEDTIRKAVKEKENENRTS